MSPNAITVQLSTWKLEIETWRSEERSGPEREREKKKRKENVQVVVTGLLNEHLWVENMWETYLCVWTEKDMLIVSKRETERKPERGLFSAREHHIPPAAESDLHVQLFLHK